MPTTSSTASTAYRRVTRNAARTAIRKWLRGLHRSGMYLFEVDGVECALEYFNGHWGMEEGGRWRWGRVGAGDPDEDMSGEDVLLEVALGGPLPRQQPSGPYRRRDTPMFSGGADLTRAEIRRLAAARACENLGKLVLHRLPPA